MWRPFFAALIETWRLGQGGRIGRWLDALGRFEALCSLASHRYEHPGDVFAEMVEQEPLFEATDLGHPLLDESACVRNDVSLGGPVRALIVSGSNMSGKSTLLRSVGLAAVMAQAGGCVRAGRLRLCPLAVGATIRIHDSLLGRTSRFYAEIQRLRLLSDMADGDVPLLFLLDEVLHGTNSRDRLAGATAVLGSLVDRGALGLVVTHDLAIAAAARELGEGVRNVHLADRVEDGRLVFDYRLRDGVVERSNALALMRQVGLPV
jgi:DNA mismatch repair ATPase MutS